MGVGENDGVGIENYVLKIYRDKNDICGIGYKLIVNHLGKTPPEKIVTANLMNEIKESQKEIFEKNPRLNSLEIKLEIENE